MGVPWSLESVVTATSGVDALSGVVASPIVASAVDGAAMAAVECECSEAGQNKMSLRSGYQAGGARRHVKQTTVVLTQPPKVQVQIHVVTVTYIPKVSCYM